jgi:NADH dehydrogenase
MSILIVGATGRVGKEAALALSKRGVNVSALVRGGANHSGAAQLFEAGVKLVAGDLCDAQSLTDTVRNVETVICSATSMPSAVNDGLRRVDHDGTLSLIEAAEQEGVRRFIYVSYSGNIRFDSPLERAKRDCEKRLMESSMEAFILRPSYFMEVWLSPMLGFDPVNGTVRIYGSGEAKGNYISSSNVADFAVAVSTGTARAKDTILEVGGPDALSQLEAVRIFERTLRKRMKVEHVPIEALQTQHNSPDPLTRSFGALMLAYAEGDPIAGAVETAREYQVQLRSLSEYAWNVASQVSIA